jgi:putrescine aminotransferase
VSDPPISRDRVVSLWSEHVNAGYARLARFTATPVEVASEGSRVRSEDGRTYLDCGGYGVFTLGHCHPRVVQAVQRQVARHPLHTHVLLTAEPAVAAGELASIAPPGLDWVCFVNSGAEATELALKLARLSGRRRVVAMDGGFHGKTLGALSVTGRDRYREPCRPLLPGVTFVPFDDLAAVEGAIGSGGERTCVIAEPVQAEAGVRIPQEGFLAGLRALCDRSGAMLVVDEVQTGLGRLGAWWGSDLERVVPDVLLAGKALGGGVVPVAAVVASADAFAPLNDDPLMHSSTFAGSPLAGAAVAAAIEASRELDVPGRARALGSRLLFELREAATGHEALVRDVRGAGLLIAIEFRQPRNATEFALGLQKRGVLACFSANAHDVVRLTPPAILTDAELEQIVAAVADTLRHLTAHGHPAATVTLIDDTNEVISRA